MNEAFMSDNTAPVDFRILRVLEEANTGFEKPYGYDKWTNEAKLLIRSEFGADAEFYPVMNGTGANVISLASVLSPFQAVICAESAHINVDECGAPERFLGSKLISVRTELGKLAPEDITPLLHSEGFEHHVQPYVISISQVTETGLAYSPQEVSALSKFASEHNLLLHIDGSRLANAAVHLGCSMGEAVKGADLVSFGGTKNGMLMGEAVLLLNPEIGQNIKYYRKQGMQLFSKMRYLSAQFIPYLRDGIWRENAVQANSMAAKLASGFVKAGLKLAYPVNSNGVFVYLPDSLISKIERNFGFYVWDEETGLCRFMCSFATTEQDVNSLLNLV
ncbi:Threonine aldolase [Denitrovibrio acetiphilus DSM 12809]|uniref:Threonine aldolase n=1 Tax=Denitrovibrio acetiphilus (strain DSM 12809 / NBRC 114555 / N2460) TaxID=522772 RepID=D4H2D0_DENA2|nr:beta-eliminating lyase-related protein [Denitrovibrio acetiphilus]ADD68921.1 Threonine aldolase [Denitrovibrio acetiphilus DSM 12809]